MLEQIVPSQLSQAVNEAIAGTIRETIIDTKVLSGGLSNALVIRLFTANRSYLLKISQEESSLKRYPLHQLAAKAGVAPPLHYIDEKNGISLSDHIDNVPGMAPPASVKAVAENLKQLHRIDASKLKDEGELPAVMDQSVGWFREQPFIPENKKAALLDAFGHIQKHYPWHDPQRVLSHNDLNPGNVLFSKQRAWFIDWDASSMNDPYVDLSMAAIFFAYSPDLEKELQNIYFEAMPSEHQLARFSTMKQLCRLVYAEKILQIGLASQPDAWQQIEAPATIELAEVAMQLQSGKLSMNTWEGKFRYGLAMFNEGLRQLTGEDIAYRLACLAQEEDRTCATTRSPRP